MLTLIQNPAQIISINTNGKNLARGKDYQNCGIITDHSVVVENSIIKDIIPNSRASKIVYDKSIDVKDKLLLPGLVECHTHAAFAGSRSNDFFLRMKGATYEEIAEAGGGILSTVKAVRESSFEDLVKILKPRIDDFISQGVTTLEIKSGYGLSFYDEIKLLQVINYFKIHSPIDIVPTFLGAHTYPPEYKNDHKGYLKLICDELLPYVIKNNLAEFADVFCERTAFTSGDVDYIFNKAKKLGYKLRLHTEQFNNISGLSTALKYKAASVDHLEVIKDEDIDILSKSDTVAVLLPGVSFFLNYDYAPARKLIDSGAVVALSTDFNPGSSNIPNIHLIMSLAALKMKMTPEEILHAVTINAAKTLDLNKIIGSIEIGKQADFSVFNAKEHSEIIYNIGKNLNAATIKKSKIIFEKNEGQL